MARCLGQVDWLVDWLVQGPSAQLPEGSWMDLTQIVYVRGGQVDVRGGQVECYGPLSPWHCL